MYVIKLKNILFLFITIIVLIFLFSYFEFLSNKLEVGANVYKNRIVIDAGHGLPDGGASVNDIIESDLNLSIAKKLEEELNENGYEVTMTRSDENNVADKDKQDSISQTKQSDLINRVAIINDSDADFCISIHMNKYSEAKYWGWQTFYSENSNDGKNLATEIQNGISNRIDKKNTRQALKISNIKIVDKTTIPVVIVECGFISNPEEAKLLQNDEYQEELVHGICDGIEAYYKKMQKGDEGKFSSVSFF